MKSKLITMLELQDRMNIKVHPQWVTQNYEWYRAIWLECGELMDHYGYKWWKKQTPDMEQVKLEVIDIWHFGLSAMFAPGKPIGAIADQIVAALDGAHIERQGVREAAEALALNALSSKGFSVPVFWSLLQAADMSFDDLYIGYVGKNVLNFFRQDNGYKEGTYIKIWNGREDNEHLVELAGCLDVHRQSFSDDLYAALTERYQTVNA